MLDGMRLGIQFINEPGQFMKAQCFDDGLVVDVVGDAKKTCKSAIRLLDAASFVEQQQSFGHAVEQRVLLRLELVKGSKLNFLEFFDFAPGRLLRFIETPTPPEMETEHRRQSEKC